MRWIWLVKAFITLSLLVGSAFSFLSRNTMMQRTLFTKSLPSLVRARAMATITDGVDYDTVAREWRFKWSADDNKKSLAEAQKVLNKLKPTIKGVDGVKSVQRVVCGGCLDFKVVVALPADKFGAWVSH